MSHGNREGQFHTMPAPAISSMIRFIQGKEHINLRGNIPPYLSADKPTFSLRGRRVSETRSSDLERGSGDIH